MIKVEKGFEFVEGIILEESKKNDFSCSIKSLNANQKVKFLVKSFFLFLCFFSPVFICFTLHFFSRILQLLVFMCVFFPLHRDCSRIKLFGRLREYFFFLSGVQRNGYSAKILCKHEHIIINKWQWFREIYLQLCNWN